jgi:hypothetical protein
MRLKERFVLHEVKEERCVYTIDLFLRENFTMSCLACSLLSERKDIASL